eukprot:6188198-Pleurochrysis_carterae.AAC.5
MPSRSISFHFACTLAAFLCLHRMCTRCALALNALSFQSHERMAKVAVPRAPDRRPPAGAYSPATAIAPLASTCCTPGSCVRGSKELVSTIDSNRARPLSGGFVNHLVGLPGLMKTDRPTLSGSRTGGRVGRQRPSVDRYDCQGRHSSSTGLRSTTERSLVRAGSASTKRLFCTTHASSWCALAARCSLGEKHPGLAHTLVRFALKVLIEESAGYAQLSAPPGVDGARH